MQKEGTSRSCRKKEPADVAVTKERKGNMEQIRMQMRKLMKQWEPELVETFRHLHRHPELSFQEFETTAFIQKELTSLGIEILDLGLQTGVVGLLKGSCEGPCAALRADIDALPILECSTSDYPSVKRGVMHACGHDTHCASLLGGARLLAAMREHLHGSVKFLFQPAEEVNLGAKKMVALGCMENPHVDVSFGIHCSSDVPYGSVAVKCGPLMASVDRINITVKGRGGHGGVPQGNQDPIVAAAAVIQSLQTIVSRNVSPIDSCVVSICNVRAGEGTTNNVTPDEVKMYGTVRNYSAAVQQMAAKRIKEIVAAVSSAYGCAGETEYLYELAVTDNHKELYPIALETVRGIGAEVYDPIPSTGGEDFSEFMKVAPGFMYWLGVRNEAADCVYPWHSPNFKADERAIVIGAGTYAMSAFEALEVLQKKSGK